MKLLVAADAREAARIVAATFVDLISGNRDVVLGVAAGRSPERAYRLLVEQSPPVERVSLVLLDEYLGIGPEHTGSFRNQIRSQLTDGLGLDPARLHTLDGTSPDPATECRVFEATIAGLGGVDLQLLGLGRNGHIGFNEPGSPFDSRTRAVRLSDTTRADNATSFETPDAVPRWALTQGIGTILEARKIILLATGHHKAGAVAAALERPVDPAVPASGLQRHHNLLVVLDEAAATRLQGP